MTLSSVCIKRPVLAIVLSIVLVLFGIVGLVNLEVREYPNIDAPIITVTTNFPGANSDVIEAQITEPLEQSINGIDGISIMSSTSREQRSQIRVEFDLDKDIDAAANDVRDRVSRVLSQLPADIENPSVEKADADATPIIIVFVSSNSKNVLDVNNFASNVIAEKIQTIKGVSSTRIFGERKYSMRLRFNPDKLNSYNMTPLDVQSVLAKENIELPSGRIEGDNTELTIKTFGRLSKPEEFNNLIIKNVDGNIIRLSDVGYAEYGPENERNEVRGYGLPGVAVAIIPQPGANVLQISDEFDKRFAEIKKDLPEGIEANVIYDFTTFVRKTVFEVEETIFIAFGLVVLIIFLFLRDWRSTFIPVVAIPVSILATFFILYLADYSINVLTLFGVILSIGLVCDDAIVVLENIYSKIEQGMSPMQAAYKGSREIFFAVVSTTITLAAVFLPIMFLQGLTGRLFREFAVVIAGSVLISAFVALTLSPMLSSRLLRQHEPGWFYKTTEPFFVGLGNLYKKSLEYFMSVRWVSFFIMIGVFGLIFWMGTKLKSELAPLEDRSNIRIAVTAPEGSSYEFTNKYIREIGQYVIDSVAETYYPIEIVAGGGGNTSVNSGVISVYLTEPENRIRTADEIFKQLSGEIDQFTGVRASISQPPTIGSRFGGLPVQFVIEALSYDKLVDILPAFMEEANNDPRILFADVNLKINKPEISLTIDRDRAADMQVSVEDIGKTLQSAFGGQRMGYFLRDGKQYEVIGQLDREYRDKPSDLRSLFVKNRNGEMIQLENLVKLEETAVPTSRFRYNRNVSATISAGLKPGYTLGDGNAAMKEIAEKVLDENFFTSFSGQSKDFEESSSSLLYVFFFSIVLIYLVLSAQFESFVDPFIIIITVPLAIAGALLSLWYFDMSINIFSQIGMIMLVGLVTKNAILIVEFANQKKAAGLDRLEAVKLSAEQRFRPILMTTLSTILGIFPIALGLGAGSRISLGIAVVGGLIFSGFLTLYIVPSLYSYISSKKVKIAEDETELANEPSFEINPV
ncbi:MAG TPA: efflux RND transporter permease subunit [Ignavibacteria bacterium]|nr:efflux RND transporter permease subunit [Ignavibacteria bacterium]HMR40520.1 efflux RND transporter permease subunit [Ignavibacteria bacterium]